MRYRRVGLALVLCLFLLAHAPPAHAQDYSFSMPQEIVDVWINPDGSISLEYWLTFTNDAGAPPIDVVDVGLPTSAYDLTDIYAEIDGQPVERIDHSEFVQPGVEVWLGEDIQPQETGTLHVLVNRVERVLYADDDDDAYASFRFSPVWFGSQFVHGTTDLTVRFHLPPEVGTEEGRWHASPPNWPQEEPETTLDDEGRVTYTWHNPTAQPDRQYIFGASFPRAAVAEGALQERPQEGPPPAPPTGGQPGLGIGGLLGGLSSCLCNPVCLIGAGFLLFGGLAIWTNRRRRMSYLPPLIKVEGVGIKRGLTAVEAAILMETPLERVLTMILFGLLKKEAVTVLDDDPLRVTVNRPLPEGLHPYEENFLDAVKDDGTLDQADMRAMMVSLVKQINTKMKGFSRRESVAYYRDIVRRAWKQVEDAETPEVRSERFNQALEWAMLDEDFEQRTRTTFGRGPAYLPPWWVYYRPWATTTGGRPATTSAPSKSPRPGGPKGPPSTPEARAPGGPQLPTLPGAAFAATFVRGIESTAGRIVGNAIDFTSKVTAVTNPIPKSTTRSGFSSGGSSCACACACACAGCACACAGGGR